MSRGRSLARMTAIAAKEFIQMRRDRLTFGMMVGIPIMQLLLFGYAIDTDPRDLATRVERGDWGPASRAVIQAMESSGYFAVEGTVAGPEEADAVLRRGEAVFVLAIPPGFEAAAARGEPTQLLLDADASDPVAAGAGIGAFPRIVSEALGSEVGRFGGEVEGVVHRRYNPSRETSINIVPGLIGIILTMTMAMMTSMALTREAERGTLETLLATPARPLEVMVAKIAPYVLVGFLQVVLMLTGARYLFGVPFLGEPAAFAAATGLFILVNLSVGFLFSTIARTQMQAMQLTFFFFLPSILLSGFMFPFSAMPGWAQMLGTALPTTHYIRAVREIMLKGAAAPELVAEMTALAVILLAVATLALVRYRRTLD